jgi:hypothetical protein
MNAKYGERAQACRSSDRLDMLETSRVKYDMKLIFHLLFSILDLCYYTNWFV